MDGLPLLTSILLCPVIGLGLIVLIPGGAARAVRWVSLLSALAATVISIQLWRGYDAVTGGLQFVERLPWVEAVGISYHLGVDGFGTIRFTAADVVRHPIVGRIVEAYEGKDA